MDAAVALVVMAGVIGLIALSAGEGRKRRGEGAEAWRAAAGVLGAEPGRTPHDGFRARVGGVEVHAAAVEHIGARGRFTRVWARARVRPQARLAIGTRRRRLQHVVLDADTAGWTDRPRHVRGKWTPGHAERWRKIRLGWSKDHGGPCHVVSDGHTAELLVGGVIADVDRLVAAVELVARIADDDLGAAAAFAELPSATPIPGALGVRLAPDDVIVEVEPHTSATVIHGTAEIGAGRIRVRSADELARLHTRWATAEVVAAFAASGAATLSVSLGETRLAWGKLELDGEKLRAGVSVVRKIASAGGDGATPYR